MRHTLLGRTGRFASEPCPGMMTTLSWPPGSFATGRRGGPRTAGRFAVDERRGPTAHDVSLEAVALAWLRHQSVVTSITLAAVSVTLSSDNMRRFDDACAPAPEHPGWMLANGSAARLPLRDTGRLPASAGAA
jgi:hypothetical protein